MQKQILLLLCIFLIHTQQQELKQVLQIFRHGARAPWTDIIPSHFTIPNGELTQVGMRQHYLLGKQMRKRYIEDQKFISSSYNVSELYIRSTNFNRTMQSCESHLQGLYPLGTGPQMPQDLVDIAVPPYKANYIHDQKQMKDGALPNKLQQIPIHQINAIDNLFGWNCPILDTLKDQQLHSEFTLNMMKEFNVTIQTLCKAVNYEYTSDFNYFTFYKIYDTLYCNRYQGYPVPQFDEETQRNLTYLYSQEYHVDTYDTKEEINLANTNILKEFLMFMNQKIERRENNPLKWITYSAHDSVLAQLMGAFNLTNKECIQELFFTGKTDSLNCIDKFPTYASQILIELYQKENTSGKNKSDYYVKLDYNGEYMYLCNQNQKTCQFDLFEQTLTNQLVPDLQQNCQIKKTNKISKNQIADVESLLKKQKSYKQ